jgi:hypothetical protein
MAIDRASIKPPVLPKEAVPVASLGGEVIVRGLKLSERLALFADLNRDGAGPAEAFVHVPAVLATTVLASDGLPVFTAEEWETHGIAHADEVFALFQVAQRLSGMDPEASKKN